MPSLPTLLARFEARLLRTHLLAAMLLARRAKPKPRQEVNLLPDVLGPFMIPSIEFDPLHPELGPEVQILARTAWGENRGGSQDGLQSVVNVIMNRVDHPGWWGTSALSVCLAREQFSCWLPDDPNRAQLLAVTMSDPQFIMAMGLAKKALSPSGLADITDGADSYYAASDPSPPRWVLGNSALGVPPPNSPKRSPVSVFTSRADRPRGWG